MPSTDTRELAARLDALADASERVAARSTCPFPPIVVLSVADARAAAALLRSPAERGEGERSRARQAEAVDRIVWRAMDAALREGAHTETEPFVFDVLRVFPVASPPAPVEGEKRYKLSAQNGEDHKLSAPVEEPAANPVCGSQGVDEDGHCVRCGYKVDPQVTEHCPAGFLSPAPVEGTRATPEEVRAIAGLLRYWETENAGADCDAQRSAGFVREFIRRASPAPSAEDPRG